MRTTDDHGQFIEPGKMIIAEEKRLALIVGVNTNRDPYQAPLHYAEDDAYEMARVLKSPGCNFTITNSLRGKDATTENVKAAVRELFRQSPQKDFLLFYFSGHAKSMKIDAEREDVYFVTHDFSESDVEIDTNAHLSMQWLWDLLYQRTNVKKVLLILDCCYAGNMHEVGPDPYQIDFYRLFQAYSGEEQIKKQPHRSRFILTATEYDTEAHEKDGHGIMTGLLLNVLQGKVTSTLEEDGSLDVDALFRYLQKMMPSDQQPARSGKGGPRCILAQYPHLAYISTIDLNRSNYGFTEDYEIYRNNHKPTHTPSFDSNLCQESSVADLDMKVVTRFFQEKRVQQRPEFDQHLDTQKLLEQFNFLQGSFPTYGALLCFGKNPSHRVEGTGTSCICWIGKTRKNGWTEAQLFEGSLLEQFESSIDFLKKNVPLGRTIDSTGRSEQWEIPFLAFQETLVNAIIHREYANQPNFVKVELFEDRLEITSPGSLPNPLTLRDLSTEGISKLRNPQIARIFYLSNHVERAGSGISRMKNEMKRAGLPAPDFTKGSPESFKVILPRPKPEQMPTSLLSAIVRVIDSKQSYRLTSILTIVGIIVWVLVQIPLATHFTRLGGIDLNSYCQSLGYLGSNADVSCSSTINLSTACDWQYKTTGSHFLLQDPGDPKSGVCYDSHGNGMGGISDIRGYCQDRQGYHGIPLATLVKHTWVCEQKINMTVACIWQFGRTDVQARKDNQDFWECYV